MRKKVYFSKIVFTDKYYISGIDVFDKSNIRFIKKININLKMDVSFARLNDVKMYLVKGIGIKIAIASVRDFKIVCFVKKRDYIMAEEISVNRKNMQSSFENFDLLQKFVTEKIRKSPDKNVMYSPDFSVRVVFFENNEKIVLKYQKLEIQDRINFYFFEEVNSDNFWVWEDLPGVSVFDSEESAKKEANLFLKSFLGKQDMRKLKLIHSQNDLEYYTYMKQVLRNLELTDKDFWWLITDYDAFPQNQEVSDMLSNDEYYLLLSTEEFVDMLKKEDFQWIWGVFSAIPSKYTKQEILEYDFPVFYNADADDYDPFRDKPRLQHPLSEFELYAWDSSGLFIVAHDAEILKKFKQSYPSAVVYPFDDQR